MRNFFKAIEFPQKITNPKTIDTMYKYWRLRIMYSMFGGYAIFYFTRKSFTYVAPELLKIGILNKVEIGMIATALYIIYGLSKFISGMISDKANPRYIMSVGLIITGIVNILFGISSLFYLMFGLWAINGFFQGWGWPPCSKQMTHWYSQRERGTWWGIWNMSTNVGGFLIPILVGLCVKYLNWQYGMYVPGVIAIVTGLWLMNRLRDVPESMGLPPIEDYKNDHPVGKRSEFEKKASTKEILYKYILKNKYIWVLAAAYLLIYIVRVGIDDWGAIYLTHKGYSVFDADSCLSFFEVGGLFGSLLSGLSSDRLFRGKRGPVNVIFSIGIVGALLVFWLFPGQNFFVHAACIFAIGFFVYGPQMLIAIAAVELSHREAAGTATGFLGLFGYIGAALSGVPFGLITQYLGWQGFFVTMIALGTMAVLLLIPMMNIRTNPKYLKKAS